MSTEQDWAARADREAARIVAGVDLKSGAIYDDSALYARYARVQQLVTIAWLEGYKAASSDALEAMTK